MEVDVAHLSWNNLDDAHSRVVCVTLVLSIAEVAKIPRDAAGIEEKSNYR